MCSKKLLEYACFHKADLEEADRDKDGNDHSGHSHSHSHGGKDTSEYDAYSHKVCVWATALFDQQCFQL